MIVLISAPSLVNALVQALATIVALTTKDHQRAERAITVLNSTRRSPLPSQVDTSTDDSRGESA
ncbi:hypothetical protein [Micromonospora sp. NPDC000668]|uniref:hypothetical protein n=1 Tax=Micromonospora sp. NPDC000668 TaxID=3364219 RepID=UPI0036C9F73A